jgi:hypothetical protein
MGLLLLSVNIIFAQNTFPATGNVGIGTASPAVNLDIESATTATLQIGNTTANTGGANLNFKGSLEQWNVRKSVSGGTPTSNSTLAITYNNGVYGGDRPMMTFFNNTSGYSVIIGSSNTLYQGNCALAVAGKIGGTELVISNQIPFPDYVFTKGYKLSTLSEIEKYIDQYSRLPEMPSADEVKKGGIEIGKMTSILSKKIEELTLYIIEMNKKIDKLETENHKLRSNKNRL